MNDALLMTMMDPPSNGDAEFNDWVNTEHLPERKTIPGFRTAIRFRNTAASPRYMAIYDLEDISVLGSAAYRAIAGDNLSPWSKRILAGATARSRFEGSLVGAGPDTTSTGGKGPLAKLLLVRWSGGPDRFDDAIVEALSTTIADSPGILQWRVFAGQRDSSSDYLGVVESTLPFEPGFTDPQRYATASHTCECAHVFKPI